MRGREESGLPKMGLVELTISEAGRALREKVCSCREYAEELIEHCESNAGLNALVSHDWDSLLRDAGNADCGGKAGLGLAGIPLALKDNINTTRLTTSAATEALKKFIAPCNAPVADALFDAGALLGAKANMHELAFGITTNNAVTGASRNPYDTSVIPGGSSGGVAVAVAARMMPGGIGTDTGGSVRLPAALCGVVGFRPTVGRYPGGGVVPISHTRDTVGPIARCVADIRLLDSIMADVEHGSAGAGLKGLRLGVPRDVFYANLDPEVAEAAGRLLDLLSNAGVEFVESDVPGLAELNQAVGFPVALFEFVEDLSRYLAENGVQLSIHDVFAGVRSPDVKAILGRQLGEDGVQEAAYLKALNVVRPKLQRAYASYFRDNEVEGIIFPTAPVPARPIGEDETIELNGGRVPTFATYIRNTDPGSNAGIPGISLPIGLTGSGLPIGMEMDGPFGSDERLLSIATAVEKSVEFTARPGLV